MRKYLILILMSLAICSFAEGQDSAVIRPATRAVQFQFGQGKARDSYLAPLLYTGLSLSMQYERWHAWQNHNLTSQSTATLQYSNGSDKGDHGTNMTVRGEYRYGVYWRKSMLSNRLTTLVGPYLGGEVGGMFNSKLSAANNPADLIASASLGASAAAAWHYTIRQQPAVVMLQVQMPIMGYAFQQEYGASYYETFYLDSGTKNKHHFTSFGNRQDLDVRLTTDLPVSVIPCFRNIQNKLRLGVAWHIETQDIHSIVKRFSTFEAVIGWVYQSVPFSRKRTNLITDNVYEAY